MTEVKVSSPTVGHAAYLRQLESIGFDMRLVSPCLLGVASLAAALVAAEATLGQSLPTERGRAIAVRQCARCPAIGRTGDSPLGLAPPFRDLPQRYPVETLAEALAEGIVTGSSRHAALYFPPPRDRCPSHLYRQPCAYGKARTVIDPIGVRPHFQALHGTRTAAPVS